MEPELATTPEECAPLVKIGGLADVVGALPKYLKEIGIDARVIMPFHRQIKERYAGGVQHLRDFQANMGWRNGDSLDGLGKGSRALVPEPLPRVSVIKKITQFGFTIPAFSVQNKPKTFFSTFPQVKGYPPLLGRVTFSRTIFYGGNH